jgi:hypothetical protein
MWYGYKPALCAYINAHIQEWISRGYLNTMKMYTLKGTEEKPSWALDKNFHQNHRGALLLKEIDRKEAPWYSKKKEFVEAPKFEGYVWPV